MSHYVTTQVVQMLHSTYGFRDGPRDLIGPDHLPYPMKHCFKHGTKEKHYEHIFHMKSTIYELYNGKENWLSNHHDHSRSYHVNNTTSQVLLLSFLKIQPKWDEEIYTYIKSL